MGLSKQSNKFKFNIWGGYLVSIGLVVLATWLKLLAQPNIIPANVPILYILAIVITATFYGLGPSILCCFLSLAAFIYFFMSPGHTFQPDIEIVPILLVFFSVGLIITYLSSNLRTKTDEAKKEVEIRRQKEAELALYHARLEELVKQRTAELEKANENLKKEIAEHKADEEALDESESLLHAFFDSPGIMRGIVEIVDDITVRHIMDNQETASFLRTTPEALRNKLSSELGEPPEIIRNWVNHFRQSLQTDKPVRFDYLDQREGHDAWLSVNVSCLENCVSGQPRFAYIAIDITERKKAEEDLEEIEERFAKAFNSSPAALSITRFSDGTFIDMNQSFLTLFGFTPDQLIGRRATELNIYDNPAEREEIMHRLNQQGTLLNYEVNARTKSGDEKKVLTSAEKIDINGESHIIWTTLDVTEMKTAQDKIKVSELRYRRLFEAAKDGILILDGNTGLILDVNPYLVKMLGLSFDEFIGKKLWELGFFKDIIANQAKFIELQRNEYIRYEDLPLRTADGRQINVEFVSNVYEVDHQKIIQCNIRNITERKQAEEKLRETSDYLNNLIEYANAPIIVWNPDFKITRFNHAFERITGRTAQEVIGGKLDILFPDVSHDESMKHIREATSGERWEVVEIPISHKDGTVRLLLWNSANIYAPDSKTVIATIAQGQDITERKKTEQFKDEFLGLVSHELRTPMTVISGSLRTAQSEGIAAEDKEMLLQNAIEGADSLSAILENMLELSRYQAGRLQIRIETIDIPRIAKSVIEKLKSTDGGHRFVLELPDDLPPVEADPVRIERIIYNLLENALKYSPDGSEIKVFARKKSGQVVTGVADKGIGISPEDKNKIFELFERLGKGAARQGLGLGLVVCKRLVEAQGGQIWFESDPEKGSTFYFSLPIHRKKD